MERLLLLLEDGRCHAEDVLTSLAAPTGAIAHVGYEEKRVALPLQRGVAANRVEGFPVVLGFCADIASEAPFILPIRNAFVVKAEHRGGLYSFKLRLGGYVNLEQYPRSLPKLVISSRDMVGQLTTNDTGTFYPATSSCPLMPTEVLDDVPRGWLEVARRLAEHRVFDHLYLLRVDPIEIGDGATLPFNGDGRIEVVDGQSLHLVASFYSGRPLPDGGFKLSCTTDETCLRMASDQMCDVALQHHSVEFELQVTAQVGEQQSHITISLAPSATATVPAKVRIPVIVRRSRSRTFLRWITGTSGAALAGLANIPDLGLPVPLKVVADVIGAGLLVLGSVVLGPRRRIFGTRPTGLDRRR